jgi:hypothetical protein
MLRRVAIVAPLRARLMSTQSVSLVPLDLKSENDRLASGAKLEDEHKALEKAIAAAEVTLRKKKTVNFRVLKDYQLARAAREKERAKRASQQKAEAPFPFARNESQKERSDRVQVFSKAGANRRNVPGHGESFRVTDFKEPWLLHVPM